MIITRLVLIEGSVPCIRGPPGTDHSKYEREALASLEKCTPTTARTAHSTAAAEARRAKRTPAEYVREAARKTSR